MPSRPAGILLIALALAVLGVSVALAAGLAPQAGPAQAPEATMPAPPPAAPEPAPQPANGPPQATDEPIEWRASRAIGEPFDGRLAGGVQLPSGGRDFFTWDPILKRSPSRAWRRHGTDRLVRTLLLVLAEHRAAHPDAPRLGIGDLSRPRGGSFDERFGGLGHASHQNGRDVDLYYPRIDRAERRPYAPRQVDRVLAQDLVDRFVAAGAQYVFVGPRLDLKGPRRIVSPLKHHNDHLHVRIPADPR